MDKFKQAKQAKQVPNPKVSLKDQMITTRLFILQRIDHPEAVAVIVMDPLLNVRLFNPFKYFILLD